MGGSSVTYLHVNNTWISASGTIANKGYPNGNNVNISSPTTPNANFIFSGCRIFNAWGSGIAASAGHLVISGCSIHNNGRGTAGGHITFPSSSPTFNITGCSIQINGNATLGVGLFIPTSTNNYLVTGNTVRNNGTAN